MKFITSCLFVLFALFISCSSSKDKAADPALMRVDSVFDFAQTSDPAFCNKDSVMATDCGMGTLYLTKNGNAIYHYYCIGSDTTIYCVGTYVMSDSGVTCTYTQDFLFADCEDCAAEDSTYKIQEPQNGILRAEKHEIMQLTKANCTEFSFYIPPTEKQKEKTRREYEQARTIGYTLQPFRGYVFWKATPDESKAVRSIIKEIPALAGL